MTNTTYRIWRLDGGECCTSDATGTTPVEAIHRNALEGMLTWKPGEEFLVAKIDKGGSNNHREFAVVRMDAPSAKPLPVANGLTPVSVVL